MAGKHETPRQKMIGMMYLVLTALLALQVSSALLHKFESLNSNLEAKVEEGRKENQEKNSKLQKDVKRRGNLADEVRAAERAEAIAQRSSQLIQYIEGIKKELIESTGGYNEEGSLKGASEETKVGVLMVGSSGSKGKAYELKGKLDEYVQFMNQSGAGKFDRIALDASEDPKLRNNSDQKNKNFAELNFAQTPLVAALAVLSEMESRVTDMETQSITKLYESIGDIDAEINKLIPFVRPKSDFVVAGTKYEAEVCLAASSTGIKPTMEANGNPIQVGADGVGKFSFTAPGADFGNNPSLKRSWRGMIKLKMPNGKDSLFPFVQEYTVVKPVISVQSAAIKSLYRNCGNKLNIQVPALGADYQPNFEITGGQLSTLGGSGNVMIIPTSREVQVKVFNRGTLIGIEKFGVKLVPLPTYELLGNGRLIDIRTGSDKYLKTLTIRFKADPGFKELLPEEATYQVSEGEITLASGRTSAGTLRFSGNTVDVSSLVRNLSKNARLIVDIKKVKRRNYKGDWEEITLNDSEQVMITVDNH
ncbi:MAG: gliding motility protein GldM [Cytophagaceae bacterium]|jgi:gliding motility-associated protein GldM|nr:gliding motility protein GldM [Cytophagaceae bacterium]